jgi:hypothetical protein
MLSPRSKRSRLASIQTSSKHLGSYILTFIVLEREKLVTVLNLNNNNNNSQNLKLNKKLIKEFNDPDKGKKIQAKVFWVMTPRIVVVG